MRTAISKAAVILALAPGCTGVGPAPQPAPVVEPAVRRVQALPIAPAPPPSIVVAPARPAEQALPPALLPPPAPPKPHSGLLRGGLNNPMPGGVFAGYQADTGLDIAGVRLPVYSIAAGTLDYSEPGHTLWTGPKDTPNCVRVELDTPIPWKNRRITHVYYAHLAQLETLQKEGETPRKHVEGGELLGISGVANHSPHLHIGLLLDNQVEQYWGTLLLADEIRRVFGGYRNGDRL